ncbi:MAG TPA: hypothetical protein VHD60_01645 [Candidatus Saccharimonadales bacterium]|nr:hypothetical protein [Candidatus Saccharimonadales bacterium]
MMFGHTNDDNQQIQDNGTVTAPSAPEPVADGTLAHDDNQVDVPSVTQPSADDFLPSPSEPPARDEQPELALPAHTDDDAASDAGDSGQLLGLKQQALQQLSPLLNHLDQSPEEKFRTTMMMIQATDNQDLIKTAYEAAQQISDEKAKAQALLDIVNEINYFTQHPSA